VIVLPAIDLRGGQVVRLRQGRADKQTVYDDDPAGVARRWVTQGAEWLHVVNLDGALGSSAPEGDEMPSAVNLQHLQRIRSAVPQAAIQFGGGLRTLEDIQMALEMGATRTVLGTAAVRRPELVTEAVQRFGADRVCLALDARQGLVYTHGWLQTSEVTAEALGHSMSERGVRHAIYTDIARDGMLDGVNVEATAALARATGLRVIASGGVATLEDISRLRAEEQSGIAGVIVGQALYSGALSLPDALRAARS
jgi:phosphoribosylformimino-5-aminoimidazole carboxamide ribotide isomerase